MEKRMVCKCDGKEGFSGNNPIFSQKHYIAIGNVLKGYIEGGSPVAGEITNDFIAMFEEDNSKFDRDRFIEFIEGKRKN